MAPPCLVLFHDERGERLVANGKFQKWLEPEGLTLLEGWAREGLTDEQIAYNIGISRKTLYDWKSRFSEICDALKKGKAVVDYEVENALLKKALSGDVTAQIFWLKCRMPKKYREKALDDNSETLEKLDDVLKQIGGVE